jgi:hypothetical protein
VLSFEDKIIFKFSLKESILYFFASSLNPDE